MKTLKEGQAQLSLSAPPAPLMTVAAACGHSIAPRILHRVTTFPERERLIAGLMKSGLESVPAQLLWGGLAEEAPAVFVVYKLLHEAYSSSPFVFRRFITEFMQAQPERFGAVFSRETLWSIMGYHPKGLVIAEVYPAIFRNRYRQSGLVGDTFDENSLAQWLKGMDTNGFLDRCFAPPLTTEQKEQARVEGWILGVS